MKRNLLFSIVLAFFAFTFYGNAQNTNLVSNGDLSKWNEENTKPENWSKAENITRNAEDYHSAPYSAEHTGASKTKDFSQKIAIEGGKTYNISFWYKTKKEGDGTDCRIWSKFDGTMSKELKAKLQGPNNKFLPNSTTWKEFSVTVTAPNDATEFTFEVRVYKGSIILWDDFSLTEVEVTSPELYVSPNYILDLGYAVKKPSVVKKISIKGTKLTKDVNVSVSKKFEISKESEIAYASSLKLPIKNGEINTQILVRLRDGFDVGKYTGDVTVSSEGAKTKVVNLSAHVLKCEVSVPFVEDFEEKVIPVNWVNYNEAGKRLWKVDVFSNNHFANVSSYKSKEKNIVWLITPKVNIINDKPSTFTFDIKSRYYKGESFNVLISEDFDGTNVLKATWKDVTTNFKIPKNKGGNSKFENAGAMELKDFKKPIYIAFKYSGDDSMPPLRTGTYCIDNVKIEVSTSVPEVSKNKLNIYPNPANNYISLNVGAKYVKVVDLSGNTVLVVNNVAANQKIDVSGLSAGIYIVKVDNIIAKFTKK